MWSELIVLITAAVSIGDAKTLPTKYSLIDCINQRCKINETSLRFVAFGDWGGLGFWPYVSVQQKKIAKFLATTSAKIKTNMIISTGDNFYFTGVHNAEDLRFQETFEDEYVDESLMYVPWYITAGNHDHYGNVSGQIAYTKESLLKRWKFPDFYYTAKYEIQDGTKIDFIFMDTVILCGNTDFDALLKKSVLGTGSDQPSIPPDPIESQSEWEWVERQLSNSVADYIFVVGHFPVYSIGEHGPTDCLVNRLQALLEKYNVSAYICGHDHNLQHLKVTTSNDRPLHYVVTGMGAYTDDNTPNEDKVPTGSSQFFYPKSSWFGKVGLAKGGLVHAKVTKRSVKFQFENGDGQLQHVFWDKPRTSDPRFLELRRFGDAKSSGNDDDNNNL